jgi:hypothetical protein
VLRLGGPTGLQKHVQFAVGDRNRGFSFHCLSSWIVPQSICERTFLFTLKYSVLSTYEIPLLSAKIAVWYAQSTFL